MGQGKGPETQVGGSITHRAQHELNGLNSLMNEDLAEAVLTVVGGLGTGSSVFIGVHFVIFELVALLINKFIELFVTVVGVGLLTEVHYDRLGEEH